MKRWENEISLSSECTLPLGEYAANLGLSRMTRIERVCYRVFELLFVWIADDADDADDADFKSALFVVAQFIALFSESRMTRIMQMPRVIVWIAEGTEDTEDAELRDSLLPLPSLAKGNVRITIAFSA